MTLRQASSDDIDRLRESIDRWRVPMQAGYDRLRHTVYGNGEVGMAENIRNLLKVINEEQDNRKWLYRTTIGVAISSLIMLLVNGFIYFYRILPILDKLK